MYHYHDKSDGFGVSATLMHQQYLWSPKTTENKEGTSGAPRRVGNKTGPWGTAKHHLVAAVRKLKRSLVTYHTLDLQNTNRYIPN